MTVKRIYACDICRDEETPRGFQGKEIVLIGFQVCDAKKFIQKGSREVERHICKPCLHGIYCLACDSGALIE